MNPPQAAPLASKFDVVLDAMFGFSFRGAPRPPFDAIIQASGDRAATQLLCMLKRHCKKCMGVYLKGVCHKTCSLRWRAKRAPCRFGCLNLCRYGSCPCHLCAGITHSPSQMLKPDAHPPPVVAVDIPSGSGRPPNCLPPVAVPAAAKPCR